jgi:hypothetical protein
MHEQPEEPEATVGSPLPEIHIDWGYERPQRGIRTVEPAVTRREITIEPPPARSATPAEGTLVVQPRLISPRVDDRIWLIAFAVVTALTLAATGLLALGLTLS